MPPVYAIASRLSLYYARFSKAGLFSLSDNLAEMSISKMRSEAERTLLTAYLKHRFRGRLTPDVEQLMGAEFDPSSVEQLTRLHQRLTVLYGSEVGRLNRLGRDLKKYGSPPDLLERTLEWRRSIQPPHEAPMWTCKSEGVLWEAAMQEFPIKHLYVLRSGGQPIWEFDDWPKPWSRENF